MIVPHRDARGDSSGDGFLFSHPATIDAPAHARAAVGAYARGHGASPEMLAALALAVSEAVTNVVVHAYRDEPRGGTVNVAAEARAGELVVTVSDQGSGLRPRRRSPGLGLGLAIIAQCSEGLDLKRVAAGGLELTMRFDLARP
jgi:anti-sigma regulatory factor (Ser/Thr protein kinase)